MKQFRIISPVDAGMVYSGRIDFSNPSVPLFVFPSSSVAIKFTGTSVKVMITNHPVYYDHSIGYILDGMQGRLELSMDSEMTVLTISEHLEDKEHELYLFKRLDACHHFEFHGFQVDLDSLVDEDYAPKYVKSGKRMLFFGDSITAGEVSEAVEYIGMSDPAHNGEYSNSWYSYAHMTARYFDAEIHNISQGGIALMDGMGWYDGPDYMGMESVYDTVKYSRPLGERRVWDYRHYIPHIVVVAIGQNDANPIDLMKEDYNSERSKLWRDRYQVFVEKLRKMYPEALIILQTSLMYHDPLWDRAIEAVCLKMKDPKLVHYLFKRNGRGTPGHLRIPEAREMAEELCAFIETFEEKIW